MLVFVTVRGVVPSHCCALISLLRWLSARFTIGAYFRALLENEAFVSQTQYSIINNTEDSFLLLSKFHRWSPLLCCKLIIRPTLLACLLYHREPGKLAFASSSGMVLTFQLSSQTKSLLSFWGQLNCKEICLARQFCGFNTQSLRLLKQR